MGRVLLKYKLRRRSCVTGKNCLKVFGGEAAQTAFFMLRGVYISPEDLSLSLWSKKPERRAAKGVEMRAEDTEMTF